MTATYHRTTHYVTEEQRRWLRTVVAEAAVADLPISGSDVVRYALERLRTETQDEDLPKLVMEHVLDEVQRYPGRAKRGLPSTAKEG